MKIKEKAIRFAYEKHENQLDDSGKSFIFHPIQVGLLLAEVTTDENLICAGFLHDIIEDTETTYEELIKEFNQDIADLVMEVTKAGNKDSHGYYFPYLKTQRGIMLKFADRLSNISRMEAWDEKRRTHYLNRSKFWKSK